MKTIIYSSLTLIIFTSSVVEINADDLPKITAQDISSSDEKRRSAIGEANAAPFLCVG